MPSLGVWVAALLAGAAVWVGARHAVRSPPISGGRPGARRPGGPRAAWGGGRYRLRRRARSAAATRAALVELADALAAELRAGRDPRSALLRAVDEVSDPPLRGVLDPVAEIVRLGGDVASALGSAGAGADLEALRWLAAAWQVAETRGAGLATAVARVAAAGRADDDQRRQVAAELAGPRATARLLALLPVAGLGLGSLLGAGPVRVLLSTPLGLACLGAGAALDLLGLWWTARIARAAEQPR